MQQNFISPKPTIDELEQKAEACEAHANQESEPKSERAKGTGEVVLSLDSFDSLRSGGLHDM